MMTANGQIVESRECTELLQMKVFSVCFVRTVLSLVFACGCGSLSCLFLFCSSDCLHDQQWPLVIIIAVVGRRGVSGVLVMLEMGYVYTGLLCFLPDWRSPAFVSLQDLQRLLGSSVSG